MSLVGTYVQMADTFWYEDPVIYNDDIFICFDDDDPPELVYKSDGKHSTKQEQLETAIDILNNNDIKFKDLKLNVHSGRMYPPDYTTMHDSISFFFTLMGPIDTKYKNLKHDGRFAYKKDIPGEGVFYGGW